MWDGKQLIPGISAGITDASAGGQLARDVLVDDSALHYEPDLADRGDIVERVTGDRDEIGLMTGAGRAIQR